MIKFTKNDLSSEINEDFKDIFIRLYDYMIDKKWMGACHALTAILFVFAKKLGIDCVPYINSCSSFVNKFILLKIGPVATDSSKGKLIAKSYTFPSISNHEWSNKPYSL